ncbi:MAG: DUF1116 domain-containing protein [Coprothermobacterota bacterium]|nr:DUF1116 domain-containing protein [Coprothermobacterota bacterium]
MRRIGSAHVFWVGMSTAGREVHWLGKGHRLLHAGPPLIWSEMCGAMRNAAMGAILYEGWAATLEEAEGMAEKGEVDFASAHAHGMLGPMAGIVSPAMPVFIVENKPFSNRVFITINEGLGKTLRFGANGIHVIERLRWIERYFAPLLEEAIALGGEVDISAIIERALQRGDECHNRNKSATSLLFRRIAPWLVRSSFSKEEIVEALFFIDGNDHFFLNLSMAASKATMDNVRDVQGSTIVSCMSANGYEFAIQVAGLGSRWFTAPAPLAEGRYFQGYEQQDANPVMGDSYLSEATGLGGVAMAAAPAITSFVGGTVQDALDTTEEMYSITDAEHPRFKIPFLDYRGAPLGIDVRKVVELKIAPVINTGIAHRLPGVGQIGAGLFRPPLDCFLNANIAIDNQ